MLRKIALVACTCICVAAGQVASIPEMAGSASTRYGWICLTSFLLLAAMLVCRWHLPSEDR